MTKKQWLQAKRAAGDAIILCRIPFGQFDQFQAFDRDAKVCAERLGLSQHRMLDGRRHVGFPPHHLEAYVAKLVACGYRVAVCEKVA